MTLTPDMVDAARLRKLADNLKLLAEYQTILEGEVRQMIRALQTPTTPAPARDPLPDPTPSTDEYVEAATSATAVWKALEGEFGIDRRTILGRVERAIHGHGLTSKYPNWSTDLKLAKWLAGRATDGRRRLTVMLDLLDQPIGAR